MRPLTVTRDWKTIWLAFAVFAALFGLLFQYRLLALLKRLGFAVVPLGSAWPLDLDATGASVLIRPLYYAADYLNIVWFTTTLGLFVGGAAATFLPILLGDRLRGDGPLALAGGLVLGLPNMFCSCCAATALPGLRRAGAGLASSLAFFVAAPSLNLVVLILAFRLLPTSLAITRVLLGLVAASAITFVVARWNRGSHASEAVTDVSPDRSLLRVWITSTLSIAGAVLPPLLAGILVISIFKTFVSIEAVLGGLGSGLLATFVASLIGTVLMVPTFTEVLWVAEFAKNGVGNGPAVALLITLPAVSLPSLWAAGRILGSYRVAVSLGLGVLLLGFVAGAASLLI